MVPQVVPKIYGANPPPAARGLCARRRVSEANRGNATALRPEMTALPRNCPQMSNDIYARPRDVEDAVTYKNQGKVWHKICRRGKP